MRVITNHSGYPTSRNISGLPFKNVEIIRGYDPFKIIDHVKYRSGQGNSKIFHNIWYDCGKPELVHLWNGISIGNSPWVSTFEDYLPRWGVSTDKWVVQGLGRMANSRCRALIAMSEAALQRQVLYAESKAPSMVEEIQRKILQIHPAQDLLINRYDEKRLVNDVVTFCLVGHEFFRKGGDSVLRVFDRLLREGAPVGLTIVSNMSYGDYASRTTRADYEQAIRTIDSYPGRIKYHKWLSNKQALGVLRSSHVGLLPTWSETYGYSVLEAQSAGCPVVTTDINALPEINDESSGWLIKVPKHSWKPHALIETETQRSELREHIEMELYRIICEIIQRPEQVVEKGRRALARIQEHHNPHRQAARLEAIYRAALAR